MEIHFHFGLVQAPSQDETASSYRTWCLTSTVVDASFCRVPFPRPAMDNVLPHHSVLAPCQYLPGSIRSTPYCDAAYCHSTLSSFLRPLDDPFVGGACGVVPFTYGINPKVGARLHVPVRSVEGPGQALGFPQGLQGLQGPGEGAGPLICFMLATANGALMGVMEQQVGAARTGTGPWTHVLQVQVQHESVCLEEETGNVPFTTADLETAMPLHKSHLLVS